MRSLKIKGQFFYQLLISLIIVAVLPVSVFFIVSFNSYNYTLADQIKRQSMFAVEQYNSNVESKLYNIIGKTNDLLMDENIQTFNAGIEELHSNSKKMDIFLSIFSNLLLFCKNKSGIGRVTKN